MDKRKISHLVCDGKQITQAKRVFYAWLPGTSKKKKKIFMILLSANFNFLRHIDLESFKLVSYAQFFSNTSPNTYNTYYKTTSLVWISAVSSLYPEWGRRLKFRLLPRLFCSYANQDKRPQVSTVHRLINHAGSRVLLPPLVFPHASKP